MSDFDDAKTEGAVTIGGDMSTSTDSMQGVSVVKDESYSREKTIIKRGTSAMSAFNDVRTEEAAVEVKENMSTLTNSMRVEKVGQDYYDTKVIEETPGTVEQVTDNIEETSQDMII